MRETSINIKFHLTFEMPNLGKRVHLCQTFHVKRKKGRIKPMKKWVAEFLLIDCNPKERLLTRNAWITFKAKNVLLFSQTMCPALVRQICANNCLCRVIGHEFSTIFRYGDICNLTFGSL